MECNFFVGQKVCCVDASPSIDGRKVPLIEGEIYVVSGFAPRPDFDGSRSISLRGVKNGPPRSYGRFNILPYFLNRRFRPVTDISDLKKIVSEVFTKKPASVSA